MKPATTSSQVQMNEENSQNKKNKQGTDNETINYHGKLGKGKTTKAHRLQLESLYEEST